MIAQAVADLAELFEAAARGLLRRRHKRHIKTAKARLSALMASYFRRQGESVVIDIRSRIAAAVLTHPAPLKEASRDAKAFAKMTLPDSVAPLRFAVSALDDDEYRSAIDEAMQNAARTLGRETGSALALPADAVERYLRKRSLSKITGNLEETSVQRLRDSIADAWEQGGSYDEIVAAVQETFDTFSSVRAGMIAQTEAVDAYNYGREETARAAGLDEKAWETESGNPCAVCIGNEADGWIDIDAVFSSGDDAPTAHVNCQCVLNFRATN